MQSVHTPITTMDMSSSDPVAAGLFYRPLGWMLHPQVSALLMSASSIIVAVNAISLRRARI